MYNFITVGSFKAVKDSIRFRECACYCNSTASYRSCEHFPKIVQQKWADLNDRRVNCYHCLHLQKYRNLFHTEDIIMLLVTKTLSGGTQQKTSLLEHVKYGNVHTDPG